MRHVVDVHFDDDLEVTVRVLAWAGGRSEADVLRDLLVEAVTRATAEEFVRDGAGRVAFQKVRLP